MSKVTILKQYVASFTFPYLMQCPTTKKLVPHTLTQNLRVAILQQDNNIIAVEDFKPSRFRSQKSLQRYFPIALNYAKHKVAGYKHLSNQAT